MAEQNEERAEQRFVKSEHENGEGEGAGKVAARRGEEGPEKQREDAEEIDAAGGAVGKLDEGCDRRVMLNDGAVAERPVVAAAGAGASGANRGSPDNDSDVVSEHAPGESPESCGGAGCRGDGSCGDHAEGPKFHFSPARMGSQVIGSLGKRWAGLRRRGGH